MTRPVAIVTAAGQGIGEACARALAEAGYALVLQSSGGGAERLARELGGIGVTGSVAVAADLEALVSRTLEAHGRIDAAVLNTGHPPKGDLLTISDQDWHAALDLLLLHVIRIARLVTPVMERQGNGAILNLSTLAAEEPDLGFPVSSTLRAGLGAFTRLYADRYGPSGIRMNTVLPGFVENYPVGPEIVDRTPLRRPVTLAEVGATVRFLLSPAAGGITGQQIRVDGGLGRSL